MAVKLFVRYCVGAIVLFLSVFKIALADPVAWKIIPDESHLTFTATQNNAPVKGEFKNFSGDIYFDPQQLATSHVRILVNIASVSTSYNKVAETLKTADWFDAATFPQAVFQATKFIKTGSNTYQANGTLKIRDKTLPVAINFILEKYTNTEAVVTGKALLKRTLFELGRGDWAMTTDIKDDVNVNFILHATKS